MNQDHFFKKKKIISLILTICLGAFVLASCASGGSAESSNTTAAAKNSGTSSTATGTNQAGSNATTISTKSTIAVSYDADDQDASWDKSTASSITCSKDSIAVNGSGATVDGSKATITAAGTYCISGTLDDGQIIVDTKDEEPVRLVLNGVDLNCSTSAPIFVLNAKKTIIILADGTENQIADGSSYVLTDPEAGEPNAAIFSKSDLTINGSGTLSVTANYKHGIVSKDELKIMSGTITINSVSDGIKGRDFVAIRDGTITIDAQADGIQSNNDEDAGKGYVVIEGGTIGITAENDGIQAETSVLVKNGSLTIATGGGSANGSTKSGNDQMMWGRDNNAGSASETTASAKGIKAVADITIQGGVLQIDSADDALNSNGSLAIDAGNITLTSGDDGIHADSSIVINGGDLKITKAYEGIESAVITVNGGNISITSSDDGFNVAGGNDGSATNGRPGQNNFAANSDYYLNINGGYIVMDASGDGLDSNGSITMTAGTVLVNGPTNDGNGAIDYNGTFKLTGGFLVAVGSSGMAEAPDTSSTQNTILVNLTSTQSADTLIHVESASGDFVLTFKPNKNYQSLVFSSPDLVAGTTYVVSVGGSSTGSETDGLYQDGTWSGGSEAASLTLSEILTTSGSGSKGGMGGGGGMKGGGMHP